MKIVTKRDITELVLLLYFFLLELYLLYVIIEFIPHCSDIEYGFDIL